MMLMVLKPINRREERLTGYQLEQATFARMKTELRRRKRRVRVYLLRRKLRGLRLRPQKTGRPESRPAPSGCADQRPMQLA